MPVPSTHIPIERNIFLWDLFPSLHSLVPQWNVLKYNIKGVHPIIVTTKHHFWVRRKWV